MDVLVLLLGGGGAVALLRLFGMVDHLRVWRRFCGEDAGQGTRLSGEDASQGASQNSYVVMEFRGKNCLFACKTVLIHRRGNL